MSVNNVSLSAQSQYIKQPKKNFDNQKENNDSIGEILKPVEDTVVNSVAPARRMVGIPDMIKQGDLIPALGLAALTVVSLPEDCRDIKAAYDHSACVLTKKRIPIAYNYKKYQHDFSFLRGTLLHEVMKRVKSERGKKIVDVIYKSDKTLYNTKLGYWLKNVMGITDGNPIVSSCKTLWGDKLNVQKVVVKNDFLGLKELTGRALKRTTVLGLAFTALLEVPRIIKSFTKGEKQEEKSKSVAKQFVKSGSNVLGITLGMGYLGAIGAKKFGAAGSLLGIGIGALVGAASSQKINNMLFKDKKKS